MEKAYSPRDIEQRNYQRWESAGWFEPSGNGTPYCIMIPPPNVTGTLHMGHAFQHTLMDTLTRLHRMEGDNALWQPGTDHAGIATQMVVERQLNAEGKHRRDLGREEFLKRVWQWKEQSGDTICKQMRRLGNSVDWQRDRFTMDEGLSKAVTEVFVKLHEENLIYRGKRLVNWDPVLHTALSDLEVQSEPEQGHLWHLKYPLADGSGHLVVATTRPETMLGDTAVAVHPEDERYKHLIGKQIKLPLTDRLIPIIGDDYVDREFGSGCVKITPAHDFNDYEMGKRHNLLLINIFNADAKIIDDNDWMATRQSNAQGKIRESSLIDLAIDIGIPEKYQHLDRFVARKQIVADLEVLGLVEKIEPHTLNVPRGDRSGAVLEPWLTDQWYVRVAPLAAPAIKAVEDGSIKFVPENWSKTYFQWMNNIQDWCISRQLWWGHRIPAWYDDQGNIYVARSEADAQQQAVQKHGKQVTLKQDDDVLDTWFSSALWPFSTLGWPEQTDRLKTFYPTNVLVTGFDIIFFWVARMIMMGLKFTGEVPFREVYITGLIRDENGDKMSKSKGNIIDPLDLIDGIDLESLVIKRTTGLMQPHLKDKIEKNTRKQFPEGIPSYGTDALRFTLASLATQGRDIRFDLGRIEGYRNFCNKLWNAARYVMMNTEGHDCSAGGELSIADRWIKSRLGHTIEQTRTQFNQYRFDLASQALYEFAWYEYCDWYLELCKPILQSDSSTAEEKRGTRYTLLQVFEGYLRLLHPLMPFVTEEIWQSIAPLARVKIDPVRNTIMLQAYPKVTDFPIDTAADQAIAPIKAAILGPRQIRGQLDVPQSRKLTLYFKSNNANDWQAIENNMALVIGAANVSTVIHVQDETLLPPTALQVVDGRSLFAPLKELIDDVDAEIARIDKRKAKTAQELTKCENKLNNANFVANAPPEVVEQERARIAAFKQELAQFEEQAKRVASLR